MFDDFIIGIDSQIGKLLSAKLSSLGEKVAGTSRRNNQDKYYLDLSSDHFEVINDVKARNVYILAAITAFNQCRENPELAEKVNLISPLKIAKFFIEKGSKVYFFSTSATVDLGSSKSTYGALKNQAEKEILLLGNSAKIIRFSKIIDRKNTLFNKWIYDLSIKNKIIAFDDLFFSPLSIDLAIDTIVSIAHSKLDERIILLSANKDISYYDAAIFFSKVIAKDENLVIRGNAELQGIPKNEISKGTSFIDLSLKDKGIFNAPDPYSTLSWFLDKAR